MTSDVVPGPLGFFGMILIAMISVGIPLLVVAALAAMGINWAFDRYDQWRRNR